MLPTVNTKLVKTVIPRMTLDFVVIHLCMLLSAGSAVLYHAVFGKGSLVTLTLSEAVAYYKSSFLWLSFIFPLMFAAQGIYTQSRGYEIRYKSVFILRSAAIGVVAFFIANFLLFRGALISRSIFVLFGPLVVIVMVCTRLSVAAFSARFDSKRSPSRPTAPVSPTILVVGGAGYIGSALLRKLLAAGYKVRVLDSLIYTDKAIRDLLSNPNLDLRVGDCRNIQSVVRAVKGVDAIIHLAAIVGDPACEQDRPIALEINYAATRMLIEVAKGYGVERLIFASSCSVYGATDVVMTEHSTVQPISLYGQTKVDSEEALLASRSDTFCPTILRLATVFGLSSRPRFDLVVNLLTAKAHTDKTITIFNSEQWRPFIHVQDVAEGIMKVLGAPVELISGEVFNLGDSRLNYTLAQVADHVSKFFPDLKVVNVENSDRRNYRVSFEKIKTVLGFECRLDLEDGISEIKQALESGAITDHTDPYYNNQKFLKFWGSPSNHDEIDTKVMAAFSHPISRLTSHATSTGAQIRSTATST